MSSTKRLLVYTVPVTMISFALNIPKFFEVKLNEYNGTEVVNEEESRREPTFVFWYVYNVIIYVHYLILFRYTLSPAGTLFYTFRYTLLGSGTLFYSFQVHAFTSLASDPDNRSSPSPWARLHEHEYFRQHPVCHQIFKWKEFKSQIRPKFLQIHSLRQLQFIRPLLNSQEFSKMTQYKMTSTNDQLQQKVKKELL